MWVDDDHFDVNHHVRVCSVHQPGTDAQLLELFAELQMRRLGRDRPLWELWFVDGLADGRVACVEKIHHALVDGVSGAGALTVLLAPEPHDPPAVDPRPVGFEHDTASWWSVTADAAREAFITKPLGWGRDLPGLPSRGRAFVQALSSLPRAAATSLNGRVGAGRRYATVQVALDDLRDVGRRNGVTVNDLVVAAVTSGLRRAPGCAG